MTRSKTMRLLVQFARPDGIIKSVECADKMMLPSHLAGSCPALTIHKSNTHRTRFIGYWHRGIPHIFKLRHIAKVPNAVIGCIAINVVDQPIRPSSVMHRPNNTVSQKSLLMNAPTQITFGAPVRERLFARVTLIPNRAVMFGRMVATIKHIRAPFFPEQSACGPITRKKLTEISGSDFTLGSHIELILRIGQGLALLTQRLRPDFIPNIQQFCNPKGRLQAAHEWSAKLEAQQ